VHGPAQRTFHRETQGHLSSVAFVHIYNIYERLTGGKQTDVPL
jgi:hypothetical protein